MRLYAPQPSISCMEYIPLHDLLQIAQLTCDHTVVASKFVQRTLDKHPFTGAELGTKLEDLSTMEKRRIHRALCRLDIYCALFGNFQYLGLPIESWNQSIESLGTWNPDVRLNKVNRFLKKFRLWEMEEILCVLEFGAKFCDDLLVRCAEIHRQQTRESEGSGDETAYHATASNLFPPRLPDCREQPCSDAFEESKSITPSSLQAS